MESGTREPLLSEISTNWVAFRQAHDGPASAASAAQQLLLHRYRGAVHRYLLAVVRDPAAADDLTQEFALALVRGEFRHADPCRGRFRDYVKGVLCHLVCRYRARQQKQPRPLADDSPVWDSLAAPDEDNARRFDEGWRAALLSRAWQALAAERPTYHAVLRFCSAHPEMSSTERAEQLGQLLNKPCTAQGVRQTLHRARERFADLLLEEVASTLEPPTLAQMEEELSELNLLKYCRKALQRRACEGQP
jgi:RNA polymerase sigma-70 factor (ECF subfamily)